MRAPSQGRRVDVFVVGDMDNSYTNTNLSSHLPFSFCPQM